MRKLTDGEWARVREVWDGMVDGKYIQVLLKGEWRTACVYIPSLLGDPQNYRVKPGPTTVTVYVHRMPDEKIIANEDDYSKCGTGWELLYSFEHEVQQ